MFIFKLLSNFFPS